MTARETPRLGSQPVEAAGTYTLDELCDLAGVTVRTVRYYISEWLLPPPVGHGATARYTDEHRNRLDLIAALKGQYLPLREIRRALEGMTSRQIADTATTVRPVPPPAAPARSNVAAEPAMSLQEESSAVDYIAGVLERSPQPASRIQPAASKPPAAGATWRRVPIADEAELLIEESAYHRRREQIDSLVAWAKRILNGT